MAVGTSFFAVSLDLGFDLVDDAHGFGQPVKAGCADGPSGRGAVGEAERLRRRQGVGRRGGTESRERAAALAVLAPVGQDDWWATAQLEQISSSYETAHAWEKFDPDARTAADRIRDEVGVRYGVDREKDVG